MDFLRHGLNPGQYISPRSGVPVMPSRTGGGFPQQNGQPDCFHGFIFQQPALRGTLANCATLPAADLEATTGYASRWQTAAGQFVDGVPPWRAAQRDDQVAKPLAMACIPSVVAGSFYARASGSRWRIQPVPEAFWVGS